jgi:hypothetical protein
MAKSLNIVPAAVLDFKAASDVVVTNDSTSIGLVGYDGVFVQVLIADLIKKIIAKKIIAKIDSVLALYAPGLPGSLVRVNPATPSAGDFFIDVPKTDASGSGTLIGNYTIKIFVGGAYQTIYSSAT